MSGLAHFMSCSSTRICPRVWKTSYGKWKRIWAKRKWWQLEVFKTQWPFLAKKTVIFSLYKGLADWPSARAMLPKKKKKEKTEIRGWRIWGLGCTEVLVYNHDTCSPKHTPFEGQFQASKTIFFVHTWSAGSSIGV